MKKLKKIKFFILISIIFSSFLDCTLYDLLQTNLLETDQRYISKSMTENDLDLPNNFLYWSDFDRLFEKVENYLKTIETRYTKYYQTSNDKIRSHLALVTKLISLG